MAAALEVLKNNTKKHLPEEMMIAVAEIMTPIKVEGGHVFVKEGEEITQIMIVECGKLIRTKLSVPEEEKASIIKLDIDKIKENSVIVDEVLPGSRPTGFYHSFEAGAKAFATVSASESSTVWLIPGEKFRALISKPEYCSIVMAALAKDVRVASKSMRGLLGKMKDQFTEENKNTVKVLSYDATSWVIDNFKIAIDKFNKSNDLQIQMEYTTERLSSKSAPYAQGFDVVCLFVNDTADADTIKILSESGVKMIANRCAGFDRVDTKAALAYGLSLARVPAYSPYAVAEMAVSLLMGVNRKIARASSRVK